METWQIILLVLVALLAIPGMLALLELRSTLKELRVFLQDTGGRLNRTLDEAETTLQNLNRASASVQHGADRLRDLAENLAGFGTAVRSVSDGIHKLTDGLMSTLGGLVRGIFTPEEPVKKEPAGE